MRLLQFPDQQLLKNMRKRTVPNIMKQRRNPSHINFLVTNHSRNVRVLNNLAR